MQHKCDLPSPEKGLAFTQVILLFRPYQDKHEFNNIWLGEIIEFEAFLSIHETANVFLKKSRKHIHFIRTLVNM
jgi:hypothetical protein